MKRLLATVVMLPLFLLIWAQKDTMSMAGNKHFRLRYVINKAELDSSFLDNSDRITDIREFLSELRGDSLTTITRVDFRGTASPDGSYEFNVWLSENRLKSFKQLLRSYIDIPDSIIFAQSSVIPWDEFRQKVAESDIPMRTEVLEIIDRPAKLVPYPGNRHIDERLIDLKSMQKGETWETLKPILAELRYGDAVFHFRQLWPQVSSLTYTVMQQEVLTPSMLHAPKVEHVFADTLRWLPRIYLKTNLIGWAAGSVNIAVEFDLAPHWSFSLPWYYCAWDYFKSTVKFRNFTVQPEFRYWPRVWSKGANDGLFIGAHFGAMAYNFAIGGEYRYQDRRGTHPALGGGLSIGYRKPISENQRWHVEFSAGAGCYALDYNVYENTPDYKEGELVKSKKKTWFGLDNAAISISYNFGLKKHEKTREVKGGEL